MSFLQETTEDKTIVILDQIKTLLNLGLNCSTCSIKESNWDTYLYLINDLIKQLEYEILGEI